MKGEKFINPTVPICNPKLGNKRILNLLIIIQTNYKLAPEDGVPVREERNFEL